MLELAPNRCEDDLNEDFGLIKVEVVLFDWLLATACGFAAAFFLFSEVCCWTLFENVLCFLFDILPVELGSRIELDLEEEVKFCPLCMLVYCD